MFTHSRGHIQIKVTAREPIIARRLLVLERALQRGAHSRADDSERRVASFSPADVSCKHVLLDTNRKKKTTETSFRWDCVLTILAARFSHTIRFKHIWNAIDHERVCFHHFTSKTTTRAHFCASFLTVVTEVHSIWFRFCFVAQFCAGFVLYSTVLLHVRMQCCSYMHEMHSVHDNNNDHVFHHDAHGQFI